MKPQSRLRLATTIISLIALTLLAVVPAANAQTASRTFPSTALGNTSAAQTLTLSNLGLLPLGITSITTSGDFAQTINCGKSLAARGSCTITVTFTPTATGTRTGVLTAKTTGGTSTANLSGTGVAPVTLSVSSMSFASTTIAVSSAAQAVTVKNAMATALTIKSIAITGDYSQTNNCGTSLAAGASCTVSVTFKPTVAGSRTGTLTITDGAVTSPQTVSLTGTGAAATIKTITLSPANPSVAKGKTQQFSASATYSNGAVSDVTSTATWTSNKTTVATVSKGLTTAVAAGSATISAALSGVTGTTTVTVPSVTLVSIAVTPATASIPKGKTQQYAAVGTYSDGTTANLTSSVTWSATTGATITTAGLATGSAVATSTITATSGTIKGTASLTVAAPALVSIAVSPATASIVKGATQQYTAVGTYTDATTATITSSVTWSATANATIAASGLATGSAAGSSTITATSGAISGSAALTVQAAALVSIAVSPATASIAKGTTQQYSAVGTYSDGTTQTLTPTWSATTGATISSAGLATGSAVATSTITATSGTIKGTASLTVTAANLVSIAVSPANASIAKGTTQQYSAVGTYSDGTTQTLTSTATWSASANVTIAAGGMATASAVGTSTITATSGSIVGTASLTVQPAALVSIAVSPATASIAKGTTQQYSAVGTYSDATTQDLSSSVAWSASANATIAAGGLATGSAAGSSTITATSGTIKGTAALTIQPPALVSIAVSPATASAPKGKGQQFSAMGTYSDASTAALTSVTWSATAGATISSNGMATAAAVGTSTITAASGSMNGTATLNVMPAALVSIAVTPATASIAKGLNQQYSAIGTYTDGTTQDLTSTATWSTTSAASITASGLATGAAQGAATVSATSGSISGTAALTVLAPALTAITVSPASASIAKGLTQQYSAMGTYTDGSTATMTSVTWSANGASINASGLATGSAQGNATISATSGSISGSASLTVLAPALTGITVSPATASIPAGTTQQYSATGTYTDGSTQNLSGSVSWSASSNVTVNGSGLVSTTAQGAATVSATYNSFTGSASLTVAAPALTAITVSPAGVSIAAGTTQQYPAMGTYTDGSTAAVTSATWSGSGVTITASGLATGTVQGPATVTATSGSISGSVALTVLAPNLTGIAISPAKVSIAAGLMQQLTATGNYTDGSTQDLSNTVLWSATSHGRITSSGLLTGLSQGPVTVLAISGKFNAIASVTVTPAALVSIAVSPFNTSIARGTTQQFSALGTYTDASTQDLTASVTWSASAGATITAGGLATGTIVGVPVITATSGTISGNAALNVLLPAITSILVSPGSVSTGLNGQQQFSATATYADGLTADVTNSVVWNSGNPSVVTISNTGFAQAVATASTAVAITATSGGITSNWAWYSSLSSLPMVCPTPTIDMKVLVVTNGQTEADFPAIKQILDYVGTPYTVFDFSVNTGGITADMLSDGSCHAYYQGVIFAFGNYIYTLPGMPTLTSYEQLFGIRQVNWFTYPGTDFGLNGYNSTVAATSSYTANFTPAAAQVFSYANTNTPLTISNAFAYLAAPADGSQAPIPAGASVTPLLLDSNGNALSVIYNLGDGRQYLTQTFDSNQYLTHDLVLAYGLLNWVTKGMFLGEYHVYASGSVDDFFINDSEWIPKTPCTNAITHDRTASDDPSLPTYRLHAADMAALSNWQNKLNQDPLLSTFKLSLAFNGVGTSGNNDWTGVSAPGVANDDLVADLQSYQQYYHWLSHTYDHPETLDGLCKSTGTGTGCGDAANIAAGFGGIDSIDLEVLTNLWVAGQTTEATGIQGIANLDLDDSDSGLQQLTFTDYDAHAMITPGVTGLDDANVSQYLYQDGVFYVVSDTSVTPTATNNNGPNPSPNVGIVNIYAPIYEVPRHANDIYYNAANWNDDAAEFNCLYTAPSPFAGYNGTQILDYVSTSFVNNMLLGDMDPQMFHQPNRGAYDGVHSLISDTYDQTFAKYEALFKLPVVSPTQSQTALLMQARNNYNLAMVTASYVGGSNPTINISIPAGSTVSAATIPVTGLNSTGAEVYGGTTISHITVNNGQTVVVPAQ